MFVRKISLLLICVLFLCGCQSAMKMAEDLMAANEALQKAAGVENVNLNVHNDKMAVSATDKKFKSLSDDEKEKTARRLAQAAMTHWTSKWPISEITVYLSYQTDGKGSTDNFVFKASDIKALPAPVETPLATGTPVAETSPEPEASASPKS